MNINNENSFELSDTEFSELLGSLIDISHKESVIVKTILSSELAIEKKLMFALTLGIEIGLDKLEFIRDKTIDNLLKEKGFERLDKELINARSKYDVTNIISNLEVSEEKKINLALRLGIGRGKIEEEFKVSKYLLPKIVGICT